MDFRPPSSSDLEEPALPERLRELFLPAAQPDETPPSVVTFLVSPGAHRGGWAAGTLLTLCREWASAGARLFLLDLSVDEPVLHGALGEENGEGVSDALLYGASVRRIARASEDGGFFFAPAGTAVADPRAVMESPRWPSLLDGFREAGVQLILYLPSHLPGASQALSRGGHAVVLQGEGEEPEGALLRTVEVVARVTAPRHPDGLMPGAVGEAPVPPVESPGTGGDGGDEPPVEEAAGSSPAAEGALPASPPVGPARKRSRGLIWILFLLLALAAAVLMGWLEIPGVNAAPGAADPVTAVPPEGEGSPGPPSVTAPPSGPGDGHGEPPPTDPQHRYGVSVAAYTSPEAAERVATRIRRALPERLVLVVPVYVGGRAYFRLLVAGTVDSAGASLLRDEVAGALPGEDPAEWVVRPIAGTLPLLLSDAPGEATDLASSLASRGIPALALELRGPDGARRYQVVLGAFQEEGEAALSLSLLGDAGLEPSPLQPLQGRPLE